jgi:hypothetical protein
MTDATQLIFQARCDDSVVSTHLSPSHGLGPSSLAPTSWDWALDFISERPWLCIVPPGRPSSSLEKELELESTLWPHPRLERTGIRIIDQVASAGRFP